MPAASKQKVSLKEWAKHQSQEHSPQAEFYRKEIRKLSKQVRDRASGQAAILDGVRAIFEEDPIEIRLPKPPNQGAKTGLVEEAFTFWSDWQVGKITPTFNPTVAALRAEQLIHKIRLITDLRRHHSKISKISICLGGDMVEGENVFPNQAFLIAGSVLEQAIKWVPQMAAKAILALAGHFDQVSVDCVKGNHGRPGSKTDVAHPKTNWDTVAYEVTKMIVKGPDGKNAPNVNFRISDDFWAVNEILGWRNLMIHGDTIPGGINGAPRYALKMGRAQTVPEIDNMFFGHFHTFGVNTINDMVYVCNGTLESDNDYALRSLAASGFPSQMLSYFSEEHGMITCDPLYLTEQGVRVPRWKRARRPLRENY